MNKMNGEMGSVPGKVEGKGNGIAVHGTPSHSYGVSLAILDHTVLPATRHK